MRMARLVPGPFAAGLAVALAAGWFLFPRLLYDRIEQPLRFSHKVHAGEQVGMACEDCHALGADGRFAGLPATARCAECHAGMLGSTPDEKILVEQYVATGREIPWLSYARLPDNAHFPHGVHVRLAGLECARCHGDHGRSDALRPYERNRLSGYGRDIWGHSLLRVGMRPGEGKKMTDCAACHREHGVTESCLDCHK